MDVIFIKLLGFSFLGKVSLGNIDSCREQKAAKFSRVKPSIAAKTKYQKFSFSLDCVWRKVPHLRGSSCCSLIMQLLQNALACSLPVPEEPGTAFQELHLLSLVQFLLFLAQRLCLLALLSKDSSLFVCFVWKLLNPTLHVSKHKACLTVSASKLDVK